MNPERGLNTFGWVIMHGNSTHYKCAFNMAFTVGDLDLLKYLISNHYIDPSFCNDLAIARASKYGHVGIVEYLLNFNRVNPSNNNTANTTVDPSADDNYAIQKYAINYSIGKASEHGHIDICKMLLADPRVDPSAGKNYAMGKASEKGHVNIVKLLLADPRVDPSASGNYAIRFASEDGHVDIVKLLLADPRVDPSADDYFAFKTASQNGHVDIVKLLLEDSGVDPSARENYLRSMLFIN